MAVTASKILEIATGQLGYTESPAGSNKTKYGEAYGWNGVSWCLIFVWWVFKQAGASSMFYNGGKTASCTQFMNWAKKTGHWVTSGYKAGDIVLFNFDKVSDADHVGICESATSSYVTCIEGNTSLTSQDNGGKVMRRTRNIYLVLGAYRPTYSTSSNTSSNTTTGGTCNVTLNVLKSGNTGNAVKALQLLLNGNGYSCGTADGDFGAKTLAAVKKYQKAKGLTADGVVGALTWSKLLN